MKTAAPMPIGTNTASATAVTMSDPTMSGRKPKIVGVTVGTIGTRHHRAETDLGMPLQAL